MTDRPIACTLDPAQFVLRRDTLLPGVIARAEASEFFPEGGRWRFSASDDLLVALATVIDAERRCCPFLTFHVIAEASCGPVWLQVTGPAGTREFLERQPRLRRGGATA